MPWGGRGYSPMQYLMARRGMGPNLGGWFGSTLGSSRIFSRLIPGYGDQPGFNDPQFGPVGLMYSPKMIQALAAWKNEMNIPGQSFNNSVFQLMNGGNPINWNNLMFRATPGSLGFQTLFRDPYNGAPLSGPGSVSPGMRDFLRGGTGPQWDQIMGGLGGQGLSPSFTQGFNGMFGGGMAI
jgi:hypothetical protein